MQVRTNGLKEFIIEETVGFLQLGLSEDEIKSAKALLLGTAAQESGFDIFKQSGRRLGIYQISPALHKSVWDNYLIHYPDLASQVRGLAGQRSFLDNPHGELITNLKYATAIALMVYLRTGLPLPHHRDIAGLAQFWHRYFNPRSHHCVGDFIGCYRELLPSKQLAAA